LLAHGALQGFCTLAIRTVAADDFGAFAREERYQCGSEAATAAGDGDDFPGQRAFAKIVLEVFPAGRRFVISKYGRQNEVSENV
jgi:hypothetical protein